MNILICLAKKPVISKANNYGLRKLASKIISG